jgi:uncharacterized protein (TIGR03435 family)
MKSTITKTMVALGGAILITAAIATVIKAQHTPSVNDSYFEPDKDKLKQLPANIAVVRPTHFPEASAKIKHVHDGDSLARTVGRNVTFRDLMAEAYDCDPGQIVLPPDVPKGGFDFLVTVSPKTRKHLRDAIEKQLGYTANSETRDTQVLVLQVKNPALPGLTLSTDGDSDINYRDGKLYFTHQPLSVVLRGMEDGLALPIVDKTGLTNNYDFSVIWNDKVAQAMRDGRFSVDGTQKVLNDWGLEFKPDTTQLEMFTVKRMH